MTERTPSDLPTRLTDKIRVDAHGCWIWTAYIQPNGYGKVYVNGRVRLAHRVVYELLGGPIADGHVLDHTCRVRSCVNPVHLRQVTQRENTLAPGSLAPSAINASRSHCPHGHQLTDHTDSRGHRRCHQCTLEYDRQRWSSRPKRWREKRSA